MTKEKPRRHYNTDTGQMLWIPRPIYGWLRRLAAAEHRTISKQLELIVTEWVRWAGRQSTTEAERVARLREAEKEWMGGQG